MMFSHHFPIFDLLSFSPSDSRRSKGPAGCEQQQHEQANAGMITGLWRCRLFRCFGRWILDRIRIGIVDAVPDIGFVCQRCTVGTVIYLDGKGNPTFFYKFII